jgi:hypothetical protein
VEHTERTLKEELHRGDAEERINSLLLMDCLICESLLRTGWGSDSSLIRPLAPRQCAYLPASDHALISLTIVSPLLSQL